MFERARAAYVYVRTNVLAHKSNFCISVVDITTPDPLPTPSLAGVACSEQETFGLLWPLALLFSLVWFFFRFVVYSKFMP